MTFAFTLPYTRSDEPAPDGGDGGLAPDTDR